MLRLRCNSRIFRKWGSDLHGEVRRGGSNPGQQNQLKKAFFGRPNPDEDVISVLSDQPRDRWPLIVKKYKDVYSEQGLYNDKHEEYFLLKEMEARWLPPIRKRLPPIPITRMVEDYAFSRFIRQISQSEYCKKCGVSSECLAEIVGQLVLISSIRMESRPIGCSLLVTDKKGMSDIRRYLPFALSYQSSPIPSEQSCNTSTNKYYISPRRLTDVVHYFDAYHENKYVLVLEEQSSQFGFMKLACVDAKERLKGQEHYLDESDLENAEDYYLDGKDGLNRLKEITEKVKCLGFVLKKGQRAFSLYADGKLQAIARLSEKKGLWEFITPIQTTLEVESHLVKELQIQKGLLPWVIEVALELVTRGHGGLFVIGNTKSVNVSAPKVNLVPQHFSFWSVDDMVEFAKLDGAVIVDREGDVQKASVILTNLQNEMSKNEKQSLQECTFDSTGKVVRRISDDNSNSGYGSRKGTAIAACDRYKGCAIVYISQNGVIDVYSGKMCYPITESLSFSPYNLR